MSGFRLRQSATVDMLAKPDLLLRIPHSLNQPLRGKEKRHLRPFSACHIAIFRGFGTTFMAFLLHALMHVPHLVHFSWSISCFRYGSEIIALSQQFLAQRVHPMHSSHLSIGMSLDLSTLFLASQGNVL